MLLVVSRAGGTAFIRSLAGFRWRCSAARRVKTPRVGHCWWKWNIRIIMGKSFYYMLGTDYCTLFNSCNE